MPSSGQRFVPSVFSPTGEWQKVKTLRLFVAAAAVVALTGAAQAALVDRGGGMIYDTVRNITWLADMNYAFTSGYAAANAGGTGSNLIFANGLMGWDAATAWANNLVFGGFSDWRLPTLNPADTTCSNSFSPGGGFPDQYFGTGCTGGELSGLFVTDLGNKAGESVLNQAGDSVEQIANLALFSNVQSNNYWSGTEYAPSPGVAWSFRSNVGSQNSNGKGNVMYAVAVRTGDVTASVPEPQTLALALLALGATVVVSRRRPH
jgi:MYXO-CTERM domain-containing protein